jgi:hypothetical protein
MALTEETLPVYMQWTAVKWIAGLGVASLFVALIAALWAVFPQRTPATLNDPDQLRISFDKILKRKHGALITAIIFFSAATLDLAIVIAASIFSITP